MPHPTATNTGIPQEFLAHFSLLINPMIKHSTATHNAKKVVVERGVIFSTLEK